MSFFSSVKNVQKFHTNGDFKAEISDTNMGFFCAIHKFKSLIKEPTCYKNHDDPTYIDLILTNWIQHFQASSILETGLSDFHKMILTVLKSEVPHQHPKVISYRN